ncbi:methylenetetrahydrofolate--tRNA-(uracil(54)-C(5))-methyltransferase (FADH(2)-oxidizing) TrmFO [Williamsoniiplasma luminosum]|uniref:Methylenetetrahydrofolate--tRNA-(uracil-5-)-methyltransferase TrmFO n=1 Tax=Williamsoniiplasma luminosum TaxID=214888 RepID=A0A2S0NJP0_9MOLU|nr:methylenetetrahydrofolate--tRNA-(uracil(54)-C(5))-methyltransferase (FADH(2)-oxidizing) TrmFO [Williamsoniiplasma luminosum]AVP49228.1 MAG: methylenetetrahydrofolate--tRNA-(uracil(54)-C(5))-methyltransferase (FADH(2)-oxidizing) TrmFO [Williamsoniiplasma luminosum]
MKTKVQVIGAGLAGCEISHYLAQKGYFVTLFESKNVKPNPVQVSKTFAELVCSNSLRSNEITNAVGTLKAEMRLLGSLVIEAAEFAQVPAGASLAVDRVKFSDYITTKIKNNPNIEVIEKEVVDFDASIPTIIATGPFTTPDFQTKIQTLLGNDDFYFFDAVAPIVKKESIDMNKVFRKNRYEKGETSDYLNCPMNKDEYTKFYQELIHGEVAISHLAGEAELKYFEGCMPVEAMAKRGEQTLLFGPMKPKGLRNLDGTNNYAVVQLRQDDAKDSLYNLVGFQTNLKWPEQKRIFQLIPGLENAEFVRYGVMHKNNFINSPKLLNLGLQLKTNPNIFFAGQITGVEGYVESSVTGIISAINLDRWLKGLELLTPPSTTVTGALIHYINNASNTDFQPMKANWGIVDDIPDLNKRENKVLKKTLLHERAIEDLQKYLNKI